MTCEQIDPGQWRLSFAEPEARFIIHTLAQMGQLYQQDVSQMTPALRAYWQGTIGSNKSAELKESQEVLSEARAELRSERLLLVENWIQEFEIAEARDPWVVDVNGEERDEFVAMLNDRRMTLAMELGITEEDMDLDPSEIASQERRQSIFEIDVLGHFILITLGPQIYRP